MAMTTCKECKTAIAVSAKVCPKCGAAQPKRTKLMTWVIGAVLLAVTVKCTLDQQASHDRGVAKEVAAAAQEAAMSPAETASAVAAREAASAAAAVREQRWQELTARARLAVATLRAHANDPESFKVNQVIGLPSGAVCITYRAKNGFGAVMPGAAAVASGAMGVATNAAEVSRLCANRSGQDLMPGL